MPKSKRAKVVHLTQVAKKTRADKKALFERIREAIPSYQHVFVFCIDNMRNNYLKDVRSDLQDCRLFFGKTKLMARALGTTPEDSHLDGLNLLASAHLKGSVGLLLTNRSPESIIAYFAAYSAAAFPRAGTLATRTFLIPPGYLYATGGAIPPEDDVPIPYTLEPELRRLGIPTRLVAGHVVLGGIDAHSNGVGEAYTVCEAGQMLDSRQTRLLKLFGNCMAEFRVRLLAYWSAATGEVTEVDPVKGEREGNGMEE